MAMAALPMSFCGTCRIFCGAPLFFRRWAAAFNPADEPLRSTPVVGRPPLVTASRHCVPRSRTPVRPFGPAVRFFARRWVRDSGIMQVLHSILVGIPNLGSVNQQEIRNGTTLSGFKHCTVFGGKGFSACPNRVRAAPACEWSRRSLTDAEFKARLVLATRTGPHPRHRQKSQNR